MPALLTSTSIRPSRSATVSAIRSTGFQVRDVDLQRAARPVARADTIGDCDAQAVRQEAVDDRGAEPARAAGDDRDADIHGVRLGDR